MGAGKAGAAKGGGSAGGKNSVTDRDRGWKALFARLSRDTKAMHLTVGIIDSEADKAAEGGGDLTMSQLGEIHEFGLGVPRRSFIADWADETKDEKINELRAMVRAHVEGKIPSFEAGLERLGNLYVAQIQKRIASNIPPPLSPITIARKGSSVALVDTGQLKSAITYRVEKKAKAD